MFTMVDVLLGVTFIFLAMSLICSAAVEGLEVFIRKRAKALQQTLTDILGDQGARDFYSHALIQSLKTVQGKPPSYIPTRTFVIALVEGVLKRGVKGTMDDVERKVQALPPQADKLKQSLLALIAAADGDLERFQTSLEDWFNAAMDRLSGWYKRRTQVIVFTVGLVFSAAYNIDTIQIFNQLSRDSALRAALVTAAENQQRAGFPQGTESEQDKEHFQEQLKALGELGLPLGWSSGKATEGSPLANLRQPPTTPMGWVLKVLGLLMTGFAVSLGAPFWFDVLNKIIVVRSTVKPGEKSPEERSKS
ncbi:hypothetical protein [Vitiosangium sp. GDMCC 1.1324]|uniref:hypothetical protein n=1 Tax=Vitiosangium sp. (strain GDMCC 1.1324) TaxID=2138576 RepID=UPI000D3CC645|nr:hypothetical protein [Vitiosangium sp. GDMCC 1.1324]PTL83116.1 hypothetical protein DAT35_13975 [Vitiosangium sp. GDMCC 1.1324]